MSFQRNVIAGFAANAWIALIGVLFVPVYVHFIGIEAYGLVGIFGTLTALSSLLDFGFTITMKREMARLSSRASTADEARNMVRTLETVYWALAVIIGLGALSLAPLISDKWLTGVQLSKTSIREALILISVILAISWPTSFYSGGLIGLQKQVTLSVVKVILGTVRALGAVIILARVSPTIHAFFGWQIVISLAWTVAVTLLFWRSLPKSAVRPKFQPGLLERVWRFSAGVSIVIVLGLILTQIDKVVLSHLLTLDLFGYYVLAGAVCSSLYVVINPIYDAVFPRLTQVVAQHDEAAEKRIYHQSSEVLAATIGPPVAVLVALSYEVILVWTGSPLAATHAGSVVALMAVGTGLFGLAQVPWALQLAHGWTRLGIGLNAIGVILFVPLLIVLASVYGAVGGAAAWALLNLFNVIANQVLMHRRLLKGELWRWILLDVGRPTGTALLVVWLSRFLIRADMPRVLLLLELGVVAGCTLLATLLVVPNIRGWLFAQLVTGYHWLQTKKNRRTSSGGSNRSDIVI